MSDFSAIIDIVTSLVTCVFNCVIDTVCSSFIIVSLISPLRWYDIKYYFYEITPDRSDLPTEGLRSFLLLMSEAFAYPSLFISSFFIHKWWVMKKIWKKYTSEGRYDFKDVASQSLTIRGNILFLGYSCIYDLLCVLFSFLLLLAIPWRREAVLDIVSHIDISGGDYVSVTSIISNYIRLDGVIFRHSLGVLVDYIFIFSVMPCLLVPTIWSPLICGLRAIDGGKPARIVASTDGYVQSRRWAMIFDDFRHLLANQIVHACIDVAVFPFLCIALLSSERRKRMVALIRKTPNETTINTANEGIENGQQSVNQQVEYKPRDFQYQYDTNIRYEAFKLGILGIFDLLILPVLLLLWTARYRDQAMINMSVISTSIRDIHDYFAIFLQGSLLFSDLIILGLSLPLLLITRIRWNPLKEVLTDNNFINNNSLIYLTAIRQLVLLFMDILMVPGALLLLVTRYRAPTIIFIWNRESEWKRFGIFHIAVTFNVLVIFHDVFFLAPAILLTIFGALRTQAVFDIITDEFIGIYSTDNAYNVGPLGVIANRPIADDPDPWRTIAFLVDILPMTSLRQQLWIQFLLFLGDIPVLLLSSIVLVTYWRSHELIREISLVDKDKSFLKKIRDPLKTADIWHIAYVQFFLLCRDALFILPLTIIIGTLYRLPGVIIEMIGKISARPIGSEALYDILSCHTVFPDRGAPLLNFQLQFKGQGNAQLIDISSPISFHVIGNDLWNYAGVTYGKTLISIARSLLPLKMRDKDKAGITEFNESVNAYFYTKSIEGPDVQESTSLNPTFWVKLDFGVPKSTSLLWKLKRLPPEVAITMQFDGIFIDANIKKAGVICRLTIRVSQLLDLLKSSGGWVVQESLNTPTLLSDKDVYSPENNFVNTFYIIVGKAMMETCLDFLFLILFIATLLSPYRFLSCVYALLEHEDMYQYRLACYCRQLIGNLDDHLLAYRQISFFISNEIVKKFESAMSPMRLLNKQSRYIISYYNNISSQTREYRSLRERFYLSSYFKTAKRIDSLIHSLKGCDNFRNLYQDRLQLHENIPKYWFLNCGVYLLLTRKNVPKVMGISEDEVRKRGRLMSNVLTEEMQKVATLLSKNTNQLDASISMLHQSTINEIQNKRKALELKKKSAIINSIGIFTRPLADTRSLIGHNFIETMKDISYLLGGIFILLSGIRTLSLFRDLYNAGSFNPTSQKTRTILNRHGKELKLDFYFLSIILVNVFIIIVTVGGIPSYLEELPVNMGSLETLAEYSINHSQAYFTYLLELLSMMFVWKNYKLVFKSSLFAFLVPGASMAEAWPITSWSVTIRFAIGIVIWMGLLSGAIAVSNSFEDSNVTKSMLTLCGVALFVLIGSGLSVLSRPNYQSPKLNSNRTMMVTWSHILALLTAPCELIQLSCVIMYYFWTNPNTSASIHDRYGSDSLSRKVLFWGSSSLYELQVTTSLACAVMFLWIVLITIPLTSGHEDSRREKLLKLRSSPMYEVIIVCITRVFTVWLIVSLMRPTSCAHSSGLSDDSSTYFISSASEVNCDEFAYWTRYISLSLLCFFLLTSSILHADDADLLGRQSINGSNYVTFSPIYANILRSGQFAIISACMGTTWYTTTADHAKTILIIIIVLSCLLAIFPVLLSYRKCCSLIAVTPLRSAGFLCVAWTALVCLLRGLSRKVDEYYQSESIVYIGWAIFFTIGIIAAITIEYYEHRLWLSELHEMNFLEKIDSLFESLRESFLLDLDLSASEGIRGALQKKSYERQMQRLERFRRGIINARSVPAIANMIRKLEMKLKYNKLTSEFLLSRTQWIDSLDSSEASARNKTTNRSIRCRSGRTELRVGGEIHGLVGVMEPAETRQDSLRRKFTPILNAIDTLTAGIEKNLSTCQISRHVLILLLSQRFPLDVCICITSYVQDTFPIRQLFLSYSEDFNRPKLCPPREKDISKPDDRDKFTEKYIKYGVNFVSIHGIELTLLNLSMVSSSAEGEVYREESSFRAPLASPSANISRTPDGLYDELQRVSTRNQDYPNEV